MTHSMNATWGPWKSYFENGGYRLSRLPAFYIYLQASHASHGSVESEAAILTTGLVNWFDFEGAFVQTVC